MTKFSISKLILWPIFLLILFFSVSFLFFPKKSLAAYSCQCSSCPATGSQTGCTNKNDSDILREQCTIYYSSDQCSKISSYLSAMQSDCEKCSSKVKEYDSTIACSSIPLNGIYGSNASRFASFLESNGGTSCAAASDNSKTSDTAKTSTNSNPLVPCGRSDQGGTMCTLCDLVLGIKGLLDYGFKIMVIVALVMLVISGIIYIVSAGDSGMMDTAKGLLKNVLIGFALILGAWLIVSTLMWIMGTSNKLGISKMPGTWNQFTCNTNTTYPTK